MPNIQVIDGAENCAYDIFSTDDNDFACIFPLSGQDVEFIEDLVIRLGEERTSELLAKLWKSPVNKKTATGIQGTLFFELLSKKAFYPTKTESEMSTGL